MNIGIIGAGMVAPHHAAAIKLIPDVSLSGITSRSGVSAEKLGKEYGIPVYRSWREIVDDPRIDIVDIVTLPDSHVEISIAAAERGKHILLEKPMAVTLDESSKIVKAAESHNVKLAVNLEYRHSDAIREIRKAIREGRLGKLIQGDAYVKWYRQPSYYQKPGKGTWSGEGGGALIGQAIHTIDLLVWAMGEVKRLFAYLHLGFSHAIESEDNGVVALQFANGALGVIQGSTSLYPGSPERLEIHGTNGTVVMEAGNLVRWEVKGEDEFRGMVAAKKEIQSGASVPMAIPVENFRRSIFDLIESIRGNRTPVISGESALYTHKVIDAIYRSGKSGKEISV